MTGAKAVIAQTEAHMGQPAAVMAQTLSIITGDRFAINQADPFIEQTALSITVAISADSSSLTIFS